LYFTISCQYVPQSFTFCIGRSIPGPNAFPFTSPNSRTNANANANANANTDADANADADADANANTDAGAYSGDIYSSPSRFRCQVCRVPW
jgi:hypothetical protein